MCVLHFYDLSDGVGYCFSVSIKRIIYISFLNVYPFDYTALAVDGKVGIP